MYAYLQEWKHVLEWVWGMQNQIKGYESGLRNDYEEAKEKCCSTLRAACRCLRWNWQQSPLWMSHSLLIMQSSPTQTTSYFRKQTNNRNPQFRFTFRRMQQSCTEKISTSFFESGRLTYHLKRELYPRKLHNRQTSSLAQKRCIFWTFSLTPERILISIDCYLISTSPKRTFF